MTGELVSLKELVARKWKNTSLEVKGSMGERWESGWWMDPLRFSVHSDIEFDTDLSQCL